VTINGPRTGSISAAAATLGDTVETAIDYYPSRLRPAETVSLGNLC
jgi:hypothetical protein